MGNDLKLNIYAKYNELDSLKKFVKDELTLKIIEAKQDTLNDVLAILDSNSIRL